MVVGATFAIPHPRLDRHSSLLPHHLATASPNYHRLSRCATLRMNRHAGPPFPVHKRSLAREIMIPHRLYLSKKAIELSSYPTLPHIRRDTAMTTRRELLA